MEKEAVIFFQNLIQTVGFPIFVAGWFMFRTDRRLDDNTKVMNSVAASLAQLVQKLTEEHK